MFQHIIRKNLIIIFSFVLLTACIPQTTNLRFSKPAEISTFGINRVAVASFQVVAVNRSSAIERNGNWEERSTTFSPEIKNEIAKQLRGKVINLISTSPSFDLVYADEFEKLENDESIQQLVASEGFRTQKVDAIINGKIWIDVNNYDGVELDKVSLEYVLNGKEGAPAYTADALLFWPYKSIKGALALEVKLTRLDPTEIIATAFEIRTFGDKIGGKPSGFLEQAKDISDIAKDFAIRQNQTGEEFTEGLEIEESDLVLPSFVQLVSDLAESVAAQFAKRISISERDVSVTIGIDGDSLAIELIKFGAFEKAISRLNEVGDGPADKYNLGLCYEAIGEYGLANVAYGEAFAADQENLTYARGLGRVERLKRQFSQVNAQLRNK